MSRWLFRRWHGEIITSPKQMRMFAQGIRHNDLPAWQAVTIVPDVARHELIEAIVTPQAAHQAKAKMADMENEGWLQGFEHAVNVVYTMMSNSVFEGQDVLAPRLSRFVDDWRLALGHAGCIANVKSSAINIQPVSVAIQAGHVDQKDNTWGMSSAEITQYLMEGALGPEFRRDTVDRYAQPHRIVVKVFVEADLNIHLHPVAATDSLEDMLSEITNEPFAKSESRQASVWEFEANGAHGLPSGVWRLRNINRCIYTL
eukprot:m.19445 g.19445  ORF g.19445 m.19445 type:complete len:258 (-) comp10905_c0_seq1:41-814(-)